MTAASQQLCTAYVELYQSGQGSSRDLAAASMHLRGVLRQSKEAFEDTEQFASLQRLYDTISRLQQDAAVQQQ